MLHQVHTDRQAEREREREREKYTSLLSMAQRSFSTDNGGTLDLNRFRPNSGNRKYY